MGGSAARLRLDCEAVVREKSRDKKCAMVQYLAQEFRIKVLDVPLARRAPALMRMIGLQDTFAESGDWDGLMRKHGISAGHIEAEAMALAAAEVP
jgi:hypothetical protein